MCSVVFLRSGNVGGNDEKLSARVNAQTRLYGDHPVNGAGKVARGKSTMGFETCRVNIG